MKRLATGGRIDRSKTLSVAFDGQTLPAYQGDTLSSAMLAGGISLVGRSFKYHRPRGIYSASVEEPGAMVHLRDGDRHDPNARATVTEAFDGLVSTGQNAWPSLKFDVGAVNNWASPFLSAGFYYKTFIGPFKHSTRFWMMCETFIRKAAGMGRASYLNDPDHYEKRNAFCDVLVIGGGVAGLSAALAAGRTGAQVMLVEQDFALGGAVLSDPVGDEGDAWVAAATDELNELSNVRILTRTTAFGAYDGNTYGLIERVSDHLKAPENHQVRQRYWQVHAKRCVMAGGAIERPLVFGGNDKPGVMLAGAARSYLNRFAVLPGQDTLVATNNDSAYAAAADLARAGATVTVADMRAQVTVATQEIATKAGATVLLAHGALETRGSRRVKSAHVVPVDAQGCATGTGRNLPVDLIAVSGGWAPAVHIWSQRYGKLVFDEASAAFIAPNDASKTLQPAGTAAAAATLNDVIAQGFEQGTEAAKSVGFDAGFGECPESYPTGPFWQSDHLPLWAVFDTNGKTKGKAFVDFQHDVKISDIDQAHLEGYVSVEHLKRYTTLGMATDQGKLSNINALNRMAELRGKPIEQVGTTTFRPPPSPRLQWGRWWVMNMAAISAPRGFRRSITGMSNMARR